MSETNGAGVEPAKTTRRVSPVTSVVMLLVGALVWFFLMNLTDLPLVLNLVIAAVAGGVAGLLIQEIVAHRRKQ